jgi:hypothetical protein
VTAIDLDGVTYEAPHVTEHHGYPLPPKDPNRFEPQTGRWNRYRLKHPETGKNVDAARATTIAKTLDETSNLERWKMRSVLEGALADPAIMARVADGAGIKAAMDDIAEQAMIAAGTASSREFGTATHAWLEEVDHGRCLPHQVPEMFLPHVRHYSETLARMGIIAPPQYVERIVWNDTQSEPIVGTLDRIFQLPDGSLCLGDVKTSKADSLAYGYLSFATQLEIYRSAKWMLSVDGSRWEPMPELRSDFSLLLHVPSDKPEMTSAITFDVAAGRVGLDTAIRVRSMRRDAKKVIPHRHAIPSQTPEQQRQQAAVLAIRMVTDPSQMATVWAEFQDIWTPALTDLGTAVVNSLHEKAPRT